MAPSKEEQEADRRKKMSSYYNQGPGPAAYYLENRKDAPAYSFGCRTKDRPNSSVGPKYDVNGQSSKARSEANHHSMGARWREVKTHETPGPGAYRADVKSTKIAPSISPRLDKKRNTDGPGPLSYNLPGGIGGRNTKAATISGRNDKYGFSHDFAQSPGPGAYNPDNYHNQPKGSTIKGRNYMPDSKTNAPGPGAYGNEACNAHLKHSPAFSMGVKHTDFQVPVFEPDDC